jgi:AcrR family transcriptional regulator
MQEQGSSLTVPGILDPTIPVDIGEQSQRQRIVDAMIESCAEKTYAATTIADIVKRASISRTTFYKRFPNKRACFDAALDSCLEELRRAAGASTQLADSPAAAVRRATATTLGLMAAKPGLAQLVMGDAVMLDPTVVGRYRRLVIPAIERLWDKGGAQPRHSDPELAFGRAQVLIFGQIAAGRTEHLMELLPELVYTTLLPFAGHEAAAREAQLTAVTESGANGSTASVR